MEEDEEDEEETDGDALADVVIEQLDPPTSNGDSILNSESTNTLITLLTGPLISLIYPTPLSFPPSPTDPSPHPPATSALSNIHIRALECLNNLFLAVDEALNGANGKISFTAEDRQGIIGIWNSVWQALGAVGKVVSDGKITAVKGLERKRELWDLVVGVLWGIGRIGRGYIVCL